MNYETQRLIGYLPDIKFLDEYAAMLADKEFIACYGVYFDHKKAEERILTDLQKWQEFGFGPWYFRNKETGEFLGRGGLNICEVEGTQEVEVAYAIKPKFWGQGIAKEIGLFSLEFAKELELQKLVCFTLPTNHQSLSVMTKCGFVFEKDFIYRDRPHKLHRLNLS